MTRLRHRDLVALVKALEGLYSSAVMASLSGRVIRCLRTLFDCDLASFDLIDLTAVHWSTLVISPTVTEWDPFIAALQRHAHEQLGASVNRRKKDFSMEQRALMELLRPHLLQAYKLARTQQDIVDQESFEAAAARHGVASCWIDSTGFSNTMTARTEQLLRRYFRAPSMKNGRLPDDVMVLLRPALGKSGAANSVNGLGRSWLITREIGGLRIRLAAKSETGRWQVQFSEEPAEPGPTVLAVRHALTPREAEILYWLGQGKTNAEIAIILSIATRTVGKHVEHLFVKLDVTNRTAAARLALSA